jgi:hypothetical protein
MNNRKSPRPTVLCAGFCGSGKTFICNNSKYKAVEVEFWQYKSKGLTKEFIRDVKKHYGKVDYIFLSTDPDGLELLNKEGYDIVLVYPKKELRNEYLDRYIERDNPYDFIGTMMLRWNKIIDELDELTYCKKIILKEGEYLKDVIDLK